MTIDSQIYFCPHALPIPWRRSLLPTAPPILFFALYSSYRLCAARSLSFRAPIVVIPTSSLAFFSLQGRDPMYFPVLNELTLELRLVIQYTPFISFHALRKSCGSAKATKPYPLDLPSPLLRTTRALEKEGYFSNAWLSVASDTSLPKSPTNSRLCASTTKYCVRYVKFPRLSHSPGSHSSNV